MFGSKSTPFRYLSPFSPIKTTFSFLIRSYLKLYTSMPLEKLAKYMSTDVDELESSLLCFKHKMMNLVWTKGTSALEGDFQSESEVPALLF